MDADTLLELRSAQITRTSVEAPIWHNDSLAMDVNDDGRVSALDALRVINSLNQGGRLSTQAANASDQYVDTNGDGRVSALDALMVINEINRRSAAAEVALVEISDDERDESFTSTLIDEAIRTLV